ncbi:hypothetical protein L7F22_010932 [Adiantum nelumboides]|nr:hypothetical protein [Adiantum nelumboides]
MMYAEHSTATIDMMPAGFLTNQHVAVDLNYPSQKMFHPLPPNVGPSVYLGAVERAKPLSQTKDGMTYLQAQIQTFVWEDSAFISFCDNFNMSRVTTAVKGVDKMGNASVVNLQAPIQSIVEKQVTKVGRSSRLTKVTIMAYALEYNDEKGIYILKISYSGCTSTTRR